MTATIDAPDLAAGVLPGKGFLFVEAAAPALTEALEAAREAYDLHERAFQERAAAFQRAHGIKRHSVPSPFAKALREAEGAVEARIEKMIVEGQIVFAGFPAGQLEGDPVPIPLAALGNRRPRGSRLKIRGVEFHDVKLYLAEALPAADPAPDVTPPATVDGLIAALVDLFREDSAWGGAATDRLAQAVASRDRRFQDRAGPAKAGRWAMRTLCQRIREVRVEAREVAGL